MAVIATTVLAGFAFTAFGAAYDQLFRAPETELRNKALQQFNEDTVRYNREKEITLEYVNYQLKLHQDAMSNFNDIDAALERYNELFPQSKLDLKPQPKLSDYYVPSNEKINTDYTLMIASAILAGFVVYTYI